MTCEPHEVLISPAQIRDSNRPTTPQPYRVLGKWSNADSRREEIVGIDNQFDIATSSLDPHHDSHVEIAMFLRLVWTEISFEGSPHRNDVSDGVGMIVLGGNRS